MITPDLLWSYPWPNQEKCPKTSMVLKYQQPGIPLCGLESMPPPEGPYVKRFYETCTRVETQEGNVIWKMRDKEFQTEEECQKYEKDVSEKRKTRRN